MPIESDSFLDRKMLLDLQEREEFRSWMVQQLVSGQLDRFGASGLEAQNARRITELEEGERARIIRDAEFHNLLAGEYHAAEGKKSKKERNSEAALKLLSLLRGRKSGELGKYRSE